MTINAWDAESLNWKVIAWTASGWVYDSHRDIRPYIMEVDAHYRDLPPESSRMKLTGHLGYVSWGMWSPNLNYAVTYGEDNSLRIWDAETGQEVFVVSDVEMPPTYDYELFFEDEYYDGLAWSPDEHYLAVRKSNVIQIIDIQKQTVIAFLPATQPISLSGTPWSDMVRLQWSTDSRRLVVAGDGYLSVWEWDGVSD